MCALMVLLFYEIGVHGKNVLQNSCDSPVSRTGLWLHCKKVRHPERNKQINKTSDCGDWPHHV